MTKKFPLPALLALAALGFTSAAQAGPVVIDNFGSSQAVLKDTSTGDGGLANTTFTAGGALGNYRDLYVQKNGSASSTDGVSLGVTGASGALQFLSDAGQNGFGLVRWDGAHYDGFGTLNYSGLGGLDLTADGATGLLLRMAGGGGPITFNVYTDASNWSSTTFSIPSGAAMQDYLLSFDTLLTGVGANVIGHAQAGAASFGKVGALELIINTGGSAPGVKFEIDGIRTNTPASAVPEPGTMALVALSLLGLAAVRRRQTGNVAR